MTQDTTTDYARRVQKVREVVAERDLDGLLILGPANRRYLSGYTVADGAIGESAGMMLVTRDRAALIVNPLYTDQAQAETADSDAEIEVVELRGRSKKLLPEKLTERGVRRLGFERDFTLYGFYEDLRENMEDGAELLPLKGIVEEMRIRKSEPELETMRRAGKIADEAYTRVVAVLRPGMTERQVARMLDEAME
nr:aminopeptidase P family N-terminal domain-containing protein [Chloroflexota bacterium]